MDRLEDLEAFLAIVEKGSQTAAAKHLQRSLQAVSRSLSALERGVGTELVRRSTRRSGPTEAGLALYQRIKPAFLEIASATQEISKTGREPSGVLRIAAPVWFASAYVVPAVCDFMDAIRTCSLSSAPPTRASTSTRTAWTWRCGSGSFPTRA